MARGHARAAGTDARVIEIDTDRVLARKQRHFAVIDVGSNSIRLVVYDDLSRAPFPRFNEKSFVALGAGLDASGRLSGKAIDMAVRAVRRFESIARAMQVETVHVLATEATRRATNGADLVAAIREATGLEPRVLSGPEEATYAALGVISGFFQPKGLAGDMGGGSLEVAEVVGDRVGERMVSMPLGALPVRAMLAEGVDTAKKQIDALLDASSAAAVDRPGLLRDRRWLAGTGARAHCADRRADQRGARPRRRGRRGAGARQEDLADDAGGGGGAARRAEPARRHAAGRGRGAHRVLKMLRPERVVFSLLGLREGWLYAQLDAEERYRDPLLEGAMAIGLPSARVPAFSAALARWTDDLFPGETQGDRRLRLAVCALTDIAWRDHEKVRAIESFRRLLQFPFIGISHPERAFLAVAILARYGGSVDDGVRSVVRDLLGPSALRRAEILGRVLLLGHRFSASVPELLEQARIRIDVDAVRLEMLNAERVPDSEAVQVRLRQLARVSGVEGAEVLQVGD